MNKKEKKLYGGILATIFDQGGFEALIEHYNGYSDCLPKEAVEELHQNTPIGEEIEQYMHVELAKKYAKYAGGKFIAKN
jgi:hypothetical protein